MTIKRKDLQNSIVDFSDVVTGRRLPMIHPGEILRDEFLEPLGISVYKLAKSINVPRSRANDIVLGRRSVTTDTALRLGRYFGTTAEFWINLQSSHDLDVAERTSRKKIEREITPLLPPNPPVPVGRCTGPVPPDWPGPRGFSPRGREPRPRRRSR